MISPLVHSAPARLDGTPLAPPRHESLVETLATAAESEAGLQILDAGERATALPWREVWKRAGEVAAGLRNLGIGRGDRVALVLPTGPAFPDAFFGALLAGAVPVPLYPPLRLGRLAEYHRRTSAMLRASGAALLLTDKRMRRLLGETVAAADPRLGCRLVEEVSRPGRMFATAPTGSHLALIQFSSGTTADPLPVALEHRAVLANLEAIDTFLPPGAQERGVSWLPLYHDMGLIGCLLAAALHPGSLTLIPPEVFLARPAIWLRAISRTRASVSPAPNFAFGLAADRVRDEEMEGVDLSCWTLALNGAEPIAPEVLRRFARRFSRWGFDEGSLLPVYGLSEAALAVTFSAPGGGPVTRRYGGREIVSVGAPVPGVSVEVRGPDGTLCAEGEEGRIHVRTPSSMRGYHGKPTATRSVLRDGWLDTGDRGLIQDDTLWVTGREKDLLVLRGANHAPQVFEDCLDGIEGVRPGCAVAVGWTPRGGGGEELALLVETRGRTEGLVERVRVAVLAATGIRPREVVLLEPGTLPRTSSGKMRRAEARRRWLEGRLTPAALPAPAYLLAALVRSQVAFARRRLLGDGP